MRIQRVEYTQPNNKRSQISCRGKLHLHKYNIFDPMLHYINKGAEASRQKQHPISSFLSDKIKDMKIMRFSTRKSISAWYINPNNSENVIFYIHGLAKNISNYQNLYEKIVQDGMGVYAVEYRGHGANPKTRVSEKRLGKDIEKAFKNLLKETGISPKKVTVVGHSMGGVLASNFVAKHQDVKSLILISPMCDMHTVGERFVLNKKIGLGIPERIYTMSHKVKLIQWLQNFHFNGLKSLKENKVPISIIHSEKDPITTIAGAKRLAAMARKQGSLESVFWLERGNHDIDANKEDVLTHILNRIYNKKKK